MRGEHRARSPRVLACDEIDVAQNVERTNRYVAGISNRHRDDIEDALAFAMLLFRTPRHLPQNTR